MRKHLTKNKIMSRAIFFCLLSYSIAACSIDAYDKGEGENSLLTAEMTEAFVNSDGKVTAVETDEGEHLALTTPTTVKWMSKTDTTYRALLYYNRVGDNKAEAVNFNRVGVLTPHTLVTKEKKDTMKTDPIYVESIWVSKNKKYVNMRLRLLTGTSDDDKAMQTIGLIRDSINSTSTHERLILYHDQGGQPEYYSSTAFASIPLAEIHADTLTITVNTYDGLLSRIITK